MIEYFRNIFHFISNIIVRLFPKESIECKTFVGFKRITVLLEQLREMALVVRSLQLDVNAHTQFGKLLHVRSKKEQSISCDLAEVLSL